MDNATNCSGNLVLLDDDRLSSSSSVERSAHNGDGRVAENDREQLSSALLALSCHFAQVQFRLQQIRKAPVDQRDALLEELERFSQRECPDILALKRLIGENQECANNVRNEELALIEQLRKQLDELEAFAYERGAGHLPSSKIMGKQRVIIDHLQGMLPINLNRMHQLSDQDLQREVDSALKQLVNPIVMKEQLVQQLQTQIVDLERFVEFLQGGSVDSPASGYSMMNSVAKKSPRPIAKDPSSSGGHSVLGNFLSQLSTMLHVYIWSQLGCHSQQQRQFRDGNSTKQRTQIRSSSHWGDLKSTLQTAVSDLVDLLSDRDCSASTSSDDFKSTPREVFRAVRRRLCPALRDLLSHGLLDDAKKDRRQLLNHFCKSNIVEDLEDYPVHVWNVIEKYYLLKHGRELAKAPGSTLSNTFQLDLGRTSFTARQVLLKTVDGILSSHLKLRRTNDAMFKAFVSAALNQQKLVPWLRMVFRCQSLLDVCYCSWAYVVTMGVNEISESLDRLSRFHFSLPVDLAVRPFTAMNDAF